MTEFCHRCRPEAGSGRPQDAWLDESNWIEKAIKKGEEETFFCEGGHIVTVTFSPNHAYYKVIYGPITRKRRMR